MKFLAFVMIALFWLVAAVPDAHAVVCVPAVFTVPAVQVHAARSLFTTLTVIGGTE